MYLPSIADALGSDVSRNSPLAQALALLFEPSEILFESIVPHLARNSSKYATYTELIDAATTLVVQLPISEQRKFIASHPRIGEVSGLSALSASEQAAVATPPTVLSRLAHLNTLYEKKYPGLVYITFVAGRTRAQIVPEMEQALGIGPAEEGKETEPPVELIESVEVGGDVWETELNRAVVDVGRIAKSRLGKLGVE